MAETVSPTSKQRAPFSPNKSTFFIGSNNDKLERSRARAARAAAIRLKPAFSTTSASSTDEPYLGKEQIFELFQNCIKLASENKINQKNTWELNLIDHICEIIKVEEENDVETNFQKASCTLEAGVKIYSMRVDYVHSEAYKVLGRISRVGQEDEQDRIAEDGNACTEQGEGEEKKQGKKLSPLSTLESSFAAINVKKFDDPLYHQTSSLFDERGARGLLLNNLGVYGNCQVLFDSSEVPGKCNTLVPQSERLDTIDLSFAKECIEEMVLNMQNKSEISPSFRAIINQLDDDDRRRFESNCSGQSSCGKVNDNPERNVDFDGNTFGDSGTWDFDNDDQASVVDDGSYDQDTGFPNHLEVPDLSGEHLGVHDSDEYDRFEEVDSYLFSSLGFSTKQNAWAGPNHWKFQKAKEPETPAMENVSPKPKKTKNKKADLDIDFSNAIENDISLIFDPPKNIKSLLLPANRAPSNTKLPEDCHYQPENLVKLFLLPHVLCLGKSRRKLIHEDGQQRDGYEATTSWDDDNGFGDNLDDGNAYGVDFEEPSSTLVSQPRQVNKVEVQYDKTSKQVDVHALKETLWDHIQKSNQNSVEDEVPNGNISFKQVLSSFPDGCTASASLNDISPHLCFICLLHLANEHGLRIIGCPSLDDLSIHLKP
ncbi:hypothetical protein CASFOL_002315 [Castilleja foliolosa]|uniref:Condensin complex subunit 2 n=1 Tax=Castilleja foliolosa TaxID=1961234 RepID=A0ABD3EEI2_9LAMI